MQIHRTYVVLAFIYIPFSGDDDAMKSLWTASHVYKLLDSKNRKQYMVYRKPVRRIIINT